MVVTVLLVTFFVTVFTNLPITVVLGFSSLAAIFASGTYPLTIIVSRMFSGIDSFTLLAIPMFILAGKLLNESGATHRIFNFANSMVGHIRGGLGHTNVVASIIFAGISGSAVADSAGLGRVEIEAMNSKGYDPKFSSAITISSSVIGPIIPPSIPMVVFGAMAGESVIKLFAGGLIPGLFTGLMLMIMVYIVARRTPDFPVLEKAGMKERLTTFKQALLPLLAPAIILGGIFSGFYTPTEASVAAVVYVIILEKFVYKELTWNDFRRILLETIVDSGAIVIIISSASIFGWLMAIERIPNMLINGLMGFSNHPYLVMLLINAVLLFLGCFIEGLAVMMILTPVLVPLVTQLGFSPIYFGVLMILNLMVGTTTPPLGMSLFVISNMTKIPVSELSRSMLPFYLALVVTLLVCLFFPPIIMLLPNLI